MTGDTALHISCRRKHQMEMIRFLVEEGAHVNSQNKEGRTAIQICIEEGDRLTVEYLHSVGANILLLDKTGKTALHSSIEHPEMLTLLIHKLHIDPFTRTDDGSTLMHLAAAAGKTEITSTLRQMGITWLMPNKAGETPLHVGARYGKVNTVREFLDLGSPVDGTTKAGFTALHIAVQACQPLVIQTLLGYGANIQATGGQNQEKPLHMAAHVAGSEECVEMLIKCGVDVNTAADNGETALHVASGQGFVRIVQLLLSEDANPYTTSKSGETPLHMAVQHDHFEVVETLLTHLSEKLGPLDATILVNKQNNAGETCIHYAARLSKSTEEYEEGNDANIMGLLLSHGGDLHKLTKQTKESPFHYISRTGNVNTLHEMITAGKSSNLLNVINRQNLSGWSPLLIASSQGHLEVVNRLINNQARVDVFDENGKAALHLAVEKGHLIVVTVLLNNKAFVNAKTKSGLTPLHIAATNGYDKIAQLLVKDHKAQVNSLSINKRTPLHLAAEHGCAAVCSMLLDNEADTFAKDELGQTALHLAAENDASEVTQLLLKQSPGLIDRPNSAGMTFVHIAASKGSSHVISSLMKVGGRELARLKNKRTESTPLHIAAEAGHKDVVELLLEAGSDPHGENLEGMTPIHLAARNDYIEIVELMRSHQLDLTKLSESGNSVIHVAALNGQINMVRELTTKLSDIVDVVQKKKATQDDCKRQNRNVKFKDAVSKITSGKLLNLQDGRGLTPLHVACAAGHLNLVRMILNSPAVEANKSTASQGVTPLHLAAQNGHIDVVGLLLSKSSEYAATVDKQGRNGLHLASIHGQLEMVALFIGQGVEINTKDNARWNGLHFAAKGGHMEIVKLLCESGTDTTLITGENKTALHYAASQDHVHTMSYLLTKEYDPALLLTDVKFLMDLMVCGKASEQRLIRELILTSAAPCDSAVKLAKSFKEMAFKEKERTRDLMTASQYAEEMAVELVEISTTAHPPDALLQARDKLNKPFLDVLIESEQKEVLAHPIIQNYMSDIWMGGLRWSMVSFIGLFLAFIVCPPVWIAFSVPLGHRYHKVPIISFLTYLASHFYLTVLLILIVAVPIWRLDLNLMPNPLEWILLVWIIGLIIADVRNHEKRTGLGLIKTGISLLGFAAVVAHLAAFGFQNNDRLICLFIRNQILAFMLLLCFIQFLDFLTFHYLFGPWVIIVGSLMLDLLRFLVILVTFMLGFTFHISAIYQPVYPDPKVDPNISVDGFNGDELTVNPLDIFELLFFALFGIVEPTGLPRLHLTPAWSFPLLKAVFGLYMLFTVIVLINLLIAMMSNTYQQIENESDTEWKYGRTQLIRNMSQESASPAPLNIVTTVIDIVRYINRRIGCRGKEAREQKDGNGRDSPSRREMRVQKIEDAIVWTSVVARYQENHLHRVYQSHSAKH